MKSPFISLLFFISSIASTIYLRDINSDNLFYLLPFILTMLGFVFIINNIKNKAFNDGVNKQRRNTAAGDDLEGNVNEFMLDNGFNSFITRFHKKYKQKSKNYDIDFGIDVLSYNNSEIHFIQCKNWAKMLNYEDVIKETNKIHYALSKGFLKSDIENRKTFVRLVSSRGFNLSKTQKDDLKKIFNEYPNVNFYYNTFNGFKKFINNNHENKTNNSDNNSKSSNYKQYQNNKDDSYWKKKKEENDKKEQYQSNDNKKQKNNHQEFNSNLNLEEALKILESSRLDSYSDIKKRYKQLMRKYHSDLHAHKNLSDEERKYNEEISKQLNSAIEVVNNYLNK